MCFESKLLSYKYCVCIFIFTLSPTLLVTVAGCAHFTLENEKIYIKSNTFIPFSIFVLKIQLVRS